MSERYNSKKVVRERIVAIRAGEPATPFEPKPRDQIVWRDGKPKVLSPLLCRLHNEPWQTCSQCSTAKNKLR
jgi:hypothetical protein